MTTARQALDRSVVAVVIVAMAWASWPQAGLAASPLAVVIPAGGASRTVAQPATGMPAPLRLVGLATWYCRPGRSACTRGWSATCLCGAASATLRAALGPAWRGARVRVTRGTRAVWVRIVDACACPRGRLIDLYSVAFWHDAAGRGLHVPLAIGVVGVEVAR